MDILIILCGGLTFMFTVFVGLCIAEKEEGNMIICLISASIFFICTLCNVSSVNETSCRLEHQAKACEKIGWQPVEEKVDEVQEEV